MEFEICIDLNTFLDSDCPSEQELKHIIFNRRFDLKDKFGSIWSRNDELLFLFIGNSSKEEANIIFYLYNYPYEIEKIIGYSVLIHIITHLEGKEARDKFMYFSRVDKSKLVDNKIIKICAYKTWFTDIWDCL